MLAVWIIFGICLLSWLVQFFGLLPFLFRLKFDRTPRPPVDRWPKCFVSVPLRGADATLVRALQSLIDQDYPDFEVHIVIDHDTDPAWDIVRSFIADTGTTRLKPSTLRERRPECSLLCGSLVQVLEDLEGQEGLLAFSAADMHPPRNWLREMATLMADPEVGATLGNRWFLPPEGQWGSLVQYLWNVGAIVPMAMQEIPWGGALCLRLADIRRAGLPAKWAKGMVEDAPIKDAIHGLGLKFRFSPQLFVSDRSEISVARVWHFVCRQLLWTRLYHPNWWFVIFNSVSTTGIMFAPWVAALVFLARGEWSSAGWSAAIGLGYILASGFLGWWMDVAMRRMLVARGEEAPAFPLRTWLRLLVAIPLTQAIYALAVVFAARTKEVAWRGVHYRLHGPWSIEMVQYRPYREILAESQPPVAPAPVVPESSA